MRVKYMLMGIVLACLLVVILVVIANVLSGPPSGNAQAPGNDSTATMPTQAIPRHAATATPKDRTQQWGRPSKASHCQVQDKLPDPACTPGALEPNATLDHICTPGYARHVRLVTESEKVAIYQAYGITSHRAGDYEVDHLVSLELGGSNDPANLWPEAAEPRPGFHEKDKVENYLHDQVCNGTLSLTEAQRLIAMDWMAVYKRLP